MTNEAPQRWYASRTPCTAWQPIFEHASAIFTRRADLRRVICTPAESWRVQRPRVAVRGAGEAALDNSRQYTPKDEVHAKAPTAIRQGAPRTATKRAPSLGAAVRIAFTTADGRIVVFVRLWPCATVVPRSVAADVGRLVDH